MKLKFKAQDFQTAAVNAVADLFAGQKHSLSTFSVMDGQYPDQTSFVQAELGFCNVLRIGDAALTDNMRAVQKRNLLPMTESAASRQFCVEMETGTGKTYVYTKTIFENGDAEAGGRPVSAFRWTGVVRGLHHSRHRLHPQL